MEKLSGSGLTQTERQQIDFRVGRKSNPLEVSGGRFMKTEVDTMNF
jgi:hypothetical protein